ncbi:F-box protein SNE [Carica papaya]|uniref:F-box protein SNE n=1 Tax=Carica papaya TaxID=3649 RepID=UPI000B8C935B|nr:F-box protein SNE [Carica papaya]
MLLLQTPDDAHQPETDNNFSAYRQEDREKRRKFCINDHVDILVEILRRLDGRSLGVAACVCRLWCTISRNDSLWEDLCFRQTSSPPLSAASLRPVVAALGGYKRLYLVCFLPVLTRLSRSGRLARLLWTRDQVQLSLSLFCVDCYERLGLSSGRLAGEVSGASSLMFLCKPVNV